MWATTLRCDGFYLEFFFFNDTATTEIYTLSLHDALPILHRNRDDQPSVEKYPGRLWTPLFPIDLDNDDRAVSLEDRKSTRLNSSHANISYAAFCLKKKHSTTTRGSPAPSLARLMPMSSIS